MHVKSLGWLLLAGACTSPTPDFDEAVQQAADPAPMFSITSMSFSNVIGGMYVDYCGWSPNLACSAAPAVQVRWGQPAFTTDKSGLGFDSAASHVLVYDES